MAQATVLMLPQLGVETVKGTPVAATRRLGAMRIEPNPEVDIETFSASGNRFNNLTILNRERVTANTPGKPTYTEIVVPLSGVLGRTTPALAEDATGAYEWVFSPNADDADDPLTYTVEIFGKEGSSRFAFGLQNQFGLSVSRNPSGGSSDISGQMLGQAMEDGIVPTPGASVNGFALVPMIPTQFDVYIDDDPAELGTTQIGKAFMAEWSYGPAFNVAEYLDSSLASFSDYYVVQTDSSLTLTFERNATAAAVRQKIYAAETSYIRLAATGPEIEASHNYEFRLDFAGQITDASWGDQDGLATIQFPFTAVYDADWGKAIEVYVKNDIASI